MEIIQPTQIFYHPGAVTREERRAFTPSEWRDALVHRFVRFGQKHISHGPGAGPDPTGSCRLRARR